ncbi:flagellar biosynthesis protein FliR [Thioclava sp. SK-1]|uniref:flagellar biosynthetic protein FliR n=1 Tax=Thioclava sp. SK-1 TaxID=1889770 RepID=UPI000825C549|nr:flagellar biosynthetic protein FliR [Thioclava sp. SK-1]OCX65302.1 flagellar biosynthesis protein FliR [Thioclava sp. SK-1]
MTELLAEVLDLTRYGFFMAFTVFIRVGAASAVMPAFGEKAVPMRVRLGIAGAFTIIVMPSVAPELAPQIGDGFPYAALLPETAAGLLMGIMLRLFVLALQTAGTIAAQATSLSQLFGGSIGEQQPAIGHMMIMAGFAVAVHMGLHVQMVELLIGSYNAFPFGEFPNPELVRSWGSAGVSTTFKLAFSIAAPFVIAGVVYNVALGAINRAMPQLMVAFVGAPALTLGGLIMLAIALPSGLMMWHGALSEFLYNPYSVMR